MAVDCLVIGGGVIGLTTAWRLAQRGLSVRLCDQSAPGREASWAGAGILPPGYPEASSDAVHRLTELTCSLWPKLSAELLQTTGIDNEFHRCGGLELSLGSHSELTANRALWTEMGVRSECLEPDEVRKLEPAFSGEEAAFLLPDLCQVRNPRHLAALIRACEIAGVEITPDCPVTGWTSHHGRITAAVTPAGEIAAGQFCVTAGAWSSSLLASAGVAMEVVPVRGQIVLLEPSAVQLTRVFERGKRYIVPRRDGRILIGSTEELTGFEKGNTDECIAELREFAADICPALRSVRMEKCWSGLRPAATRGRPFIGPVPGWENLLVATGHFRSGLHFSPATAELIVSYACEQSDLSPWSDFRAS